MHLISPYKYFSPQNRYKFAKAQISRVKYFIHLLNMPFNVYPFNYSFEYGIILLVFSAHVNT